MCWKVIGIGVRNRPIRAGLRFNPRLQPSAVQPPTAQPLPFSQQQKPPPQPLPFSQAQPSVQPPPLPFSQAQPPVSAPHDAQTARFSAAPNAPSVQPYNRPAVQSPFEHTPTPAQPLPPY